MTIDICYGKWVSLLRTSFCMFLFICVSRTVRTSKLVSEKFFHRTVNPPYNMTFICSGNSGDLE